VNVAVCIRCRVVTFVICISVHCRALLLLLHWRAIHRLLLHWRAILLLLLLLLHWRAILLLLLLMLLMLHWRAVHWIMLLLIWHCHWCCHRRARVTKLRSCWHVQLVSSATPAFHTRQHVRVGVRLVG
jgi:hypothetical protein